MGHTKLPVQSIVETLSPGWRRVELTTHRQRVRGSETAES